MRKFLVYFRVYLMCGEYEYYTHEVVLDKGSKANVNTFENKLNSMGCGGKEILSWSLIEE